MTFFKKVWAWIKKYPWALLVALVSLAGAALLLLSRQNSVESLDDAVQIRAAVREIARKEARARELEAQADSMAPEVERLKEEIAASKKRVMEIHNAEPLQDKSDDDIARLFSDAGF